jgi:hypothetical protein
LDQLGSGATLVFVFAIYQRVGKLSMELGACKTKLDDHDSRIADLEAEK